MVPLRGRDARMTWPLIALLLTAGPASSRPAAAQVAVDVYQQTNLVSDIPGLAMLTDPNLVNPWGMSHSATSPFWVSNAGTATSTLYAVNGATGAATINPLVVTTPGPISGQVFNGSGDFGLSSGGPARFIFAGLDGTISGWNPSVPTAAQAASLAPGAVYTGLALASSGGSQYLYAANNAAGTIDVYDSSFALTSLPGNFTDPTLPGGNAPFNVTLVDGELFVTYEGPGAIVNVFGTDGTLHRRFASGGTLLNPWGVALAPATFGKYAGALLVGNFNHGDPAIGPGWINAFDPLSGAFLGLLEDPNHQPIAIDGLWQLLFGNGANGGRADALYFAAGIDDETHGLFGSLQAVPEPGAGALLAALAVPALLLLCRRRA